MSLLEDLKTFLTALAVGVALTLSINYVVVNYTESAKPAPAASQPAASVPAADRGYEAPSPVLKTDPGSPAYGAYY